MSSFDLTTLANVKAWLGLPATPTLSDTMLASLITATSRAIYASLSRGSLLPASYTDTIDLESKRTFLSHWPVYQINGVTLNGLSVPAAPTSGAPVGFGYLLQPSDGVPPGRPQAMDIFGNYFDGWRKKLIVSYSAGYAVFAETWTVPASSNINVLAPYGPFASDLGVVYTQTGAPLTSVAVPTIAGQYSVSNGLYTFSAADVGASVSLSYGYVPQDLVQAATEYVGERFKAAERIGLRSKSLGGQETISYDVFAMSAAVAALIAPYKRTMI